MKKKVSVLAIALLFVAFNSFVPSPGYQVGDKAKDFKLKNVDGKMVSLSDYKKDKGAIVIFTCNHCPFSVAYEDRIIAMHKKYAPLGYPVIAINPNDEKIEPDDSYDGMVKRSKEKNFPFAYLYDQSQFFAKAYGATRTPHAFVLKKNDSDFIVEYIGAIDDNVDEPAAVTKKYLENALDELIAGKKPSTNYTKAIGCTIKWKKS